jgi:prophage antirepressor-like protein
MLERFGESSINILDLNGKRWIKAADCAKALDYKNYRHTVSAFIESNKELLGEGVSKIDTPSKGGNQETWYFDEKGLIAFLIKTNQPKAIPFQKWAVSVLAEKVKEKTKEKQITLRSKSKKVRVEFTDTLKAHGYKQPHEYIQTTYMMKTRLGIDKNRPKNDLSPWELCRVVLAEVLSTARLEVSSASGYNQCKPLIESSTSEILKIDVEA